MPLQITSYRSWICFMNWAKRTFRWLERCESTEWITSGDVSGKDEEDAEHMASGRIWQLKSWSRNEWQQCRHDGIELSWHWTIGGGEEMVTGWQEVYWHHTALRDWPVQLGHVEELIKWIRTFAHITFQSGHRSGTCSLHSSHNFLTLPCKAQGWSIGRLQQLPFQFSAICIEYSNSFI